MPITPTYPGIYIEELQSNAHTIVGAPTSVTVFVGYTHPFKTNPANWGKAVEIFSFTDYERGFGGLYTSGVIESHVAYAVSQFFLNGGSDAYIVALQPSYYDALGNNQGLVQASSVQVGPVTFTAKEPIDLIPMTVTINNIKTTFQPNDTADVLISYGPRGETFRKVTLNPSDTEFHRQPHQRHLATGYGNGQRELWFVSRRTSCHELSARTTAATELDHFQRPGFRQRVPAGQLARQSFCLQPAADSRRGRQRQCGAKRWRFANASWPS